MDKVLLKKTYRVLCLEDNPLDQQLLEATLGSEGLTCDFMNARSREVFEKAVERIKFDLIISDFSLPGYDGLSALSIAQQTQADTPFLFLSGTIGEERAIESLKKGATDYVLKNRRDRLVSAVQRALRESEERAERKRLEEQLRQSQKMEAVGQLAGGVAHDFNNLLAVIRGNAELALMSGDIIGPRTLECLKQVTTAADRAANLTRQLLAFGRKQAMQPQLLNLNDVIKNLTKMLTRVISENINFQCNFTDSQPVVHADTSMMEQVLLNLIVNARDAMPEGGEIIVSTERINTTAYYLKSHSEASMGEFICLKVTDTGTGIAPGHLPHIFEPFFSTKEIGKGTGLGLATVYGIVKQHRGWIDVESQLEKGTTFKIFFPAANNGSAISTPVAPKANPVRGTETVLLVEDDTAVRSFTRRLLENFGYKVIEADSGVDALKIWETEGERIDLLITDLVMPGGITGRELAEKLTTKSPPLRVIYMSGYSLNVISKDTDFLTRNKNNFLQKPFLSDALLNTVRESLDGRTSAARAGRSGNPASHN
ncbi:MAG TPA: response regulator [Verrucomicrobiae bacterium]|jgi:signal transduction histidine kinase|nr:response regulator [Verrucomicrobiae bacterium]